MLVSERQSFVRTISDLLKQRQCMCGGLAQLGERVLCKHDVNGSSPLASMSERFRVYFAIALDRSGFVAYIIEPRDEEAKTTRKREAAARKEERFSAIIFFPSLTKSVEGCTLDSVIRPGERREQSHRRAREICPFERRRFLFQ